MFGRLTHFLGAVAAVFVVLTALISVGKAITGS